MNMFLWRKKKFITIFLQGRPAEGGKKGFVKSENRPASSGARILSEESLVLRLKRKKLEQRPGKGGG